MKKKLLLIVIAVLPLMNMACSKDTPEWNKDQTDNKDEQTKEISSLSVLQAPDKREYALGEKIDTKGLRIKVTYSDGSSKDLSVVPTKWIIGFSSETPAQSLTVHINPLQDELGKASGSFTVSILPIHIKDDILVSVEPSDFTRLNIPEGIAAISEEAFAGNTTIESVVLPSSLKELGTYVFHHGNLQKVDMSKTALRILPSGLFESCTKLKEVIFPKGLIEVGPSVFLGNTALEEVRLPEGVEKISRSAFTNSGLVKISLPNSILNIERAFYNCTNLREVKTYGKKPDEKKIKGTIEGECFQKCKNLEILQIPLGIERIGSSVLGECKVTKLELPESVTWLDFNAFGNATSLKEVVIVNKKNLTTNGHPFPDNIDWGNSEY